MCRTLYVFLKNPGSLGVLKFEDNKHPSPLDVLQLSFLIMISKITCLLITLFVE